MSDRPIGDAVDQEFRRLASDIATVPGPTPELDELHSPVMTLERERTMTQTTKYGLIGAVAAAVAIIVGLALFLGDGDDGGIETIDTPEESTTTVAATTTTTAVSVTTQEPVAASGECGLAVAAAVGGRSDSVTFEVTSDPACDGETVQLSATPASQGLPILKDLTLDATGVLSVSDQLFGTRKAEQDWSVQVVVSDSGSVAATSEFTVTGFCDLEASADLQATYLPETNEVTIVLTVDPLCAGTEFAFDREGDVIGTRTPGGWDTFTVDENGRIEVTRRVLASGPFITIEAMPAEGRVLAGKVGLVTIDVSG